MPTFSPAPHFIDPLPNPGDEPYFEAAARGVVAIKTCQACGRPHHYPRAICPFCWSADVVWTDAQGTGVIYSFCVTRRGAAAPYCIAYVTLNEGPTLMTQIVDTDLDTVRIGQRVQARFARCENGTMIPVFVPFELDYAVKGNAI